MRALLTLALMVSAHAFGAGTTVSTLCTGQPDNRYAVVACPESSSGGVLSVPTDTGAAITGLANDYWQALLYTAPDGVCDDYSDANRAALFDLVQSNGNGIPSAQATSLTVDWGSPGLTNQCIALYSYGSASVGNVTNYGPFTTTTAGSGGARNMNWNTGGYISFKEDVAQDSDGNWLPAATFLTDPRVSQLCLATGPGANDDIFTGLVLHFEWGTIEPNLNNREAFHAFYTDLRNELRTNCGESPKQTTLTINLSNSGRDGREGLSVPYEWRTYTGPAEQQIESNAFQLYWQNNAGRHRSAARFWDNPTVKAQYLDMWQDIANRHGDEYLESVTVKGEGAGITAAAVPNNQWDETDYRQQLLDMATDVGDMFPLSQTYYGTNNFRVADQFGNNGGNGYNGLLFTLIKPELDTHGRLGIRWPDSFTASANSNAQRITFTGHGGYYHMFQGQVPVHAEAQIPGNRYRNFADLLSAWSNPADPVLSSVPDAEFRNPADGTLGFAPVNKIYGATHMVYITYDLQNYPMTDVVAEINANYGGVHPVLNPGCPAVSLAQNYQCVDNEGNVIP